MVIAGESSEAREACARVRVVEGVSSKCCVGCVSLLFCWFGGRGVGRGKRSDVLV
jgi:hypothetical protein